jgi:peptide/nickel transport system substrate-binding protein
MKRGYAAILLTLIISTLGCAGTAPKSDASAGQTQESAAPSFKRITAGIAGDAHTVIYRIAQATAGATPGVEAMEELVHAGLTNTGDQGLRPLLAEAVPTLENGLWKLLPDGRMETRWTIKPGVEWHDGTPFTTADLLFTSRVSQERSDAIFYDIIYQSIDSVEAVDDRTVLVRWHRPYIDAQRLFSRAREFAPILPRHLLETAYAEDPTDFFQHLYFSEQFVGMGAFKLKSWERSSYAVFQANDRYILGRPKIDEIEVRFIPQTTTLLANILAGQVEMTIGRGISLEQGLDMGRQWRDGTAHTPLKSWQALFPQFINPKPAIMTNVQFRRALLHALDRQQIADTLVVGRIPVAHGFFSPEHPDYRATEHNIVRYDYDVRRATQIMEELGYSRGNDGIFRDATGERLWVQIATGAEEDAIHKMNLPIADAWRRFGLDVESDLIPAQRLRDREYRAQFPSLQIQRRDNELGEWRMFHSSRIALASNGFVGTNAARYNNPEWDALIERYDVTIPEPERIQVVGQIIRHISEQLPMMGITYSTEPVMVSNRIRNVDPKKYYKSTHAWNAHEWDVAS